MPIPPVSTAFLFMYADAISGSQTRAGGVTDIGLGIWGNSLSGAPAQAGGIADIALLVYSNSQSGSVAMTSIQEDIIFTEVSMYGSAVGGSLGAMRLFLDPSVPVFNRYLPEGQSS